MSVAWGKPEAEFAQRSFTAAAGNPPPGSAPASCPATGATINIRNFKIFNSLQTNDFRRFLRGGGRLTAPFGGLYDHGDFLVFTNRLSALRQVRDS